MNNIEIVKQFAVEIKNKSIAYTNKNPTHTFHFSVPEVATWTYVVTHQDYIHPLGELFARINPASYGVIGVLCGSMESSALQLYDLKVNKIVVCDIDMSEYVSGRDMASYAYRNICGTQYGKFQGEYVYIRADSTKTKSIDAVGPYDLFFIDGQHDKTAVISDLNTAWRNLTPNGVIMVHDIDLHTSSVREGYETWIRSHDTVIEHFELENFYLGLGVIVKKTN